MISPSILDDILSQNVSRPPMIREEAAIKPQKSGLAINSKFQIPNSNSKFQIPRPND
jgi:hypothetical protein